MLGHLLLLVACLTVALDFTVDLFELAKSLIDSGVELHGVLSSVLESLLKVSYLAGQLALGRLVLGVLFLNLRQVLQLDSLTLEH